MKCFICENDKNFVELAPELCSTPNFLCTNCGLVFIPKRESLQNYYKDDGYYKKSPNKGLKKEVISKKLLTLLGQERLESIINTFDINFENKDVLDVGCGYGHLLFAIKEKFKANVEGIEPSVEVAKMGEEFFGISITADILENINTEKKYDVILCNHTLEHVDNTPEFLSNLKKHLKQDGILYIEVPNIMKPSGGFTLNAFLYNEHLQTFSAYNLEKLLNKNELQVKEFNSDTFLKFIVSLNTNAKSKIPEIKSKQILNFLRNYKKNYNIFNHISVYYRKFLYLIKVIKAKL